jgi:MarR family transcriptional regulator, organic hydroperoxide resistance regulator
MSRYARRIASAPEAVHHTLAETESAVRERIDGLAPDMTAMAAVQSIYRAANAIRNHVERTVLAPHGLTWTGWVVLWVVWIWGEIESRHVAEEAGISKGTLTGVVATLESKALITRRAHPDDGRRVLLKLSRKGTNLMQTLFPEFNAAERSVIDPLTRTETKELTKALRTMVQELEESD